MFKKYPSIENHYNARFLSKIEYEYPLIQDTMFVAREKIHGTNFSVIITADEIIPCKRSGPIAENESFFGHNIIMEKYKDNFKRIQKMINNSACGDLEGVSFQIFGEFAGGGIQKEVDYGEKDFYVFDIISISSTGADKYFEDDGYVTIFCLSFGLKQAPLLKIGTLEELLKLNNSFESVVHDYKKMYNDIDDIADLAYYEFPIKFPINNVAEGIVIKPRIPLFLSNGSRVIIKSKNSKFSEKKNVKKITVTKLSELDSELLNSLSEYVTEARVSNVISKIGEITSKDFGKILGMVMKDIFDEANREEISIESAENQKSVKKELQKIALPVVRTAFVKFL